MRPTRSIDRLRPFGLMVTAKSPQGISAVPPRLLDRLARRERLIVLRGFSAPGRDEFLRYCSSFPGRKLLQWDFGPVMEMQERPGAKNYLFSREKVPFHWDGAFHQVPTYLMFHCVSAPTPGAGGETLFCDTGKVWEDAKLEEKALFSRVELTYRTEKLAHYGGEVTGALVQAHPGTARTILRFAEPVETALNPVSMSVAGLEPPLHEGLLALLRERIYDEAYCYRHSWRQGDVLIADNHALIHGRAAYERDCPRHLRRIQLL